jgi:anti-sigma28 factor (negative regulator of flagellin synthesis)
MDSLGGVKDASLVDLFSNITGTIKGLMQSTAAEDDQGLVGRIIGNRSIIAQAIQDIQQYGQVTAGTLSAIQQSLVTLPPSASAYVEAMIQLYQASQNVTRAQEELNRVTQEYDDKISPLRGELEALQNQEANISDEKRIAALKQAIARGALNDEQEAAARREIRARELAMQIRTLEDEKETAVDAAQVKLDAAEKEQKAAEAAVALQQSLIDAQLESNSLINQQISLLDRLAGTMAAVGAGIADALGDALGGGAGLATTLGDALDMSGLELDTESMTSLFDDLDIASMVAEIEKEFEPLETQMGTLGETFTNLGDAWDDFLERLGLVDEEGKPAVDWLGTLSDALFVVGGAILGIKVGGLVTGLATLLSAGAGAGGVMGTLGAIIAALGGPITVIIALIGVLAAIVATDFMGIRTAAEQLVFIIIYYFELFVQSIVDWDERTSYIIEGWVISVKQWFADVGESIAALGAKIALKAGEIKIAFFMLGVKIKEEIEKIKGFFTDAKTAVTDMRTLFDEQIGKISSLFADAKQAVFDFWGQLKGIWEWIKSHTFDINLPSLPGGGGGIPDGARASGGPVKAGGAYLVGEEGPEVYVPEENGQIIPNGGKGAATAVVGTPTQQVYFTGDIILGDGGAVDAFVSWLRSVSDSAALNGEILQFTGA